MFQRNEYPNKKKQNNRGYPRKSQGFMGNNRNPRSGGNFMGLSDMEYDYNTKLSGQEDYSFGSTSGDMLMGNANFDQLLSPSMLGMGRPNPMENELRLRESQLEMTTKLLKQQTNMLAQVGSVLRNRDTPPQRNAPHGRPDRNNWNDNFNHTQGFNIQRGSNRYNNYDENRGFQSNQRNTSQQYQAMRGRSQQRGNERGRGRDSRRGMPGRVMQGGIQKKTHSQQFVKVPPAASTKKQTPKVQHKPLFQKVEDIPPYNADVPTGIRYIKKVEGYYCKLCSKFYRTEDIARNVHTKQEVHYNAWKATVEKGIETRHKQETLQAISDEMDVEKTNGSEAKKIGEDTNDAKDTGDNEAENVGEDANEANSPNEGDNSGDIDETEEVTEPQEETNENAIENVDMEM